MTIHRSGVVQIVALVIAFGVIGLLFARQEANTANDLRDARRQDIAVCEGGQKLSVGQSTNINQLADIALQFARTTQERQAVQDFRAAQLRNVPQFDCDSLPPP